ncbi:hypothetical protein LCGC14_2481070 [marine sediment metagenome]|uniref:Uncharacterized protein n=1 Tax=marine sediment metagenome TaxID=412755 RepID=A0A0F9BVB7_9ZZZZ
MTEELDPVPQITLNHLGIGDVDIDINKLAKMVETWVDVRIDEQNIEIETKLVNLSQSIQDVIDDFYGSVLKYLKSGMIVSINVGLIGFGYFLKGVMA